MLIGMQGTKKLRNRIKRVCVELYNKKTISAYLRDILFSELKRDEEILKEKREAENG